MESSSFSYHFNLNSSESIVGLQNNIHLIKSYPENNKPLCHKGLNTMYILMFFIVLFYNKYKCIF